MKSFICIIYVLICYIKSLLTQSVSGRSPESLLYTCTYISFLPQDGPEIGIRITPETAL